jgi:uncharacterized surface protein with fasciclin (FAS1) repeats
MSPLLKTQQLRQISAAGVAALCLTLSACDSALITGTGGDTENTDNTNTLVPDPGNNIMSVLQSDEEFETLSAAIAAAGLTDLLSSMGSYTLFAPNDAAFEALGTEAVDALLADPDTLEDILLYHVIADQQVDAGAATELAGTTVASANGATFGITLDGDSLMINDATVTRADIDASNGIIHEIDAVLTPPEDTDSVEPDTGDMFSVIQADENFSTLTAALEATGLSTVLANTDQTYTLFAPTNAAFDALGGDTVNALLADTDRLTNILLYHVISEQSIDSATAISLSGTSVASANSDLLDISLDGAALMINDATVTRADINTSNGLVHEIDTVLTPPADVDVVATLAGMPEYSTLVSLVQSADLADTLADATKTYTLFAPTNDAFAALDAALLAGLAADEAALTTILLGHVVDGSVNASAATALDGGNVTTLSGAEWPVVVTTDGDLTVGGAEVIEADVTATNGIIHGIDAVLQ